MSTWTYDLTTDIGKVRLLIGDNDIVPVTDAHFSDEEIQAFIDMASGVLNLAAAMALEAWASTLTSSMTSEHIGDYSYSKKEVDDKLALAARYRNNEANTPQMDWAEPDYTNGSGITAEED